MKRIIRRLCLAVCTLLAVGVAVLWVRGIWRCDEIGYYTYKPVAGQPGLDRRQLIGSWRGGLFWLSTEADAGGPNYQIDWSGGEPTEIIVRHTADAQLATAALQPANAAVAQPVQPIPRWRLGGFNLKTNGDVASPPPTPPGRRWWYRLVVVPDWALFLLLAWPPLMTVRWRWIVRYRRKQGRCLACGYDLRASGDVCSECGASRAGSAPGKAMSHRPAAKRWMTAAACAVLVAAACSFWFHHRRGEHFEPTVRLDRATALSAEHLPQRVEVDLGQGVTMRFALIPAGRFAMGSPPDEVGRDDDETQHQVIISKPFYMGITPVTQEQYQAVMHANPSYFKGPKNPVETVTWTAASEFCVTATKKIGRAVHLPTEAQWEYACRADTTTAYNTGPTLPRDRANYHVGYAYPSNRVGHPEAHVRPVGSFPPNAWGLYDMHGSVWQWCGDYYAAYTGDATDPAGPRQGDANSSRVLRGGSWFNTPPYCRYAFRNWISPVNRTNLTGFRVCLDF